MSSYNMNSQDFAIIKGMELKHFYEFIRLAKQRYKEHNNQLSIIASLDDISIELFCSKDGKIYTGTEALYKIIRTDYDEEPDEIDF